MESAQRKSVQEQFVNDQINIITATIAFGMGIDKPNVRLVVHYTFPKTLEGYYQEIGRAGRDGLRSECVLFYTYADVRKHDYFIDQIEDPSLRKVAREKLEQVMRFATLTTCRKKYILKYFGEDLPGNNCGSCDICGTKRATFDGTVIAQKILSAVVRTGQRWGCTHIVNVLLGEKTPSITSNGHDALSVFGIAGEFTANALRNIFQQLIDHGLLSKAEGEYPVYALPPRGADFLRNRETIELVRPVAAVAAEISEKADEPEFNAELFEILRALRREIAEKAGVPPFVVFGDTSLQDMARYFPRNGDDFECVSGVGAAKLEKYGEPFLREITRFVHEHGIEPPPRPEKSAKRERRTKTRKPHSYAITGDLLMKKVPLEEIAGQQGVQLSTVLSHMETLLNSGVKLDLDYISFPPERLAAIKKAFAECGNALLKPVFDHLGEKYSFDEIRLARVLLKARGGAG